MGKDVALHRLLQLLLGRSRWQFKLGIQGVELEE